MSTSEWMRYVFLYQLFRCTSCETNFEISSFAKLILLAMASMVIVLALNVESLLEVQANQPGLKNYLMAGTLVVTLVFAFVLSRRPAFVARKSQIGFRFMLHFATVIAMPGSLLLFAYMAEHYGKLGSG